jgi:hypothetical protein
VGSIDRGSDLAGNRQGSIHGKRAVADDVRQRLPGHPFHDECRYAVRVFQPVNLRDVGMIEGREQSRFPLEPHAAGRISREAGWKTLDGDLAPEPHVTRVVHVAHPA